LVAEKTMPPLADSLIKPTLVAKGTILLALAVTIHAAAPRKDPTMNPTVAHESGFTVIGIETRTSNAKEMTREGVIGKQWARFMKENLTAQIANRSDSTILAVYTDYASDMDGEYTFILGARVTSTTQVPSGMIARQVQPGRYAIFTSERGPVAKVVSEAWQKIWSVPKSSPGGDRSYNTDYEVYDERAANPENAQVEIHIGIN
jgi:predicted transcriptional regulator YdeE